MKNFVRGEYYDIISFEGNTARWQMLLRHNVRDVRGKDFSLYFYFFKLNEI